MLLPTLLLPLLAAAALTGCAHAQAGPCGICPSDAPGAVGNFSAAALSALCDPTGNGFPTNTALTVQGVTSQDDNREFLVNLGLVSNRGVNSRPTPYHDKVTLYAGVVAEAGTGDVWAMNPLVTQAAGSGDYNAQVRPRAPACAGCSVPGGSRMPVGECSVCVCVHAAGWEVSAPRDCLVGGHCVAPTRLRRASSWTSTTRTPTGVKTMQGKAWLRPVTCPPSV
jgi:hypothetical protein